MEIYQTNPTFVFQMGSKVYKIFNDELSCKNEFELLNRGDNILISSSSGNNYDIHINTPICFFNEVLVLKRASGKNLIETNNNEDAAIVGKCLGKYHKKNISISGTTNGKLLGDFAINHIFIDAESRKIELIDPGANYMVDGNYDEDVSRFLFSVIEAYRYRPYKAILIMRSFLFGYSKTNTIDHINLVNMINFRKKRSLEKYRMQQSFIRASFGEIVLSYNKLIILRALKC